MTFPGFPGSFPRRPRRPPQPLAVSRRSKLILAAIAALVVLVVLLVVFGLIYTDWLWFKSVGYESVFSEVLKTKIMLFFVFGLFMALIVGANIVIAFRLRPEYRPPSLEQQALDRYRSGFAPFQKWLLAGLLLLIGISAGISAANRWRTWVTWRHAQPFGIDDPQFGKDLSYFVFTYSFQRWILGFLFTATVLSILAATATHYFFGSLRIQTPGEKVTPAARAHLSSLLGVFVLLKAVAYFLDRYGLAFSDRGIVTGPSYTDVHAVLPAKTILAVIAVICAGLFFANIAYRQWILPIVAFGVMVVSAIVIGGVYPALVQQFSVKPSEADKEQPYIQRNINATRAAYDIVPRDKDHPEGSVDISGYNAATVADPKALRTDAANLTGIRLIDPNVLAPTYDQLQQIRGYYSFPDVLDIDRYPLDATHKDSVVAVRDVDLGGLSGSQRSWINEHLVYTHGYGFVGAPANTADEDGKPVFFEKNIPPKGVLPEFEPRVYFGENSPRYSIVGAPEGATPKELDRPTSTDSDEGESGQVNTTYTGDGGVDLNSPFRRLFYAMKFGEKNILLSNRVGSYSKILYTRDPRDRVRKVAPYLRLDGDPYPAVIDGKIVWIVDGYTTSNGYPYAERTSFGSATRDTLTQTSTAVRSQASNKVNYIRNSVKATVDAYDGTVSLYEWDTDDPVLKTWEHVFPDTVQPKSAIPDELIAHFRYPEDLFKVQRQLLTKYHIGDAKAFYSGQDFWQVPNDPTTGGTLPQPPYYLSLAMPDQDAPTFSLTATLVPRNRPNLAAFLSVNSDPGSAAESDYGTIRVLQLPRDTQINGPEQVNNNFESFPDAAKQLSLLRTQGSRVTLGNLLTIPISRGLLYVEPVYVQANGPQSYPLLKFVFASFGESIAFEPTLDRALNVVFRGEANLGGIGSGTGGSGTGGGGGGGQVDPDVRRALFDARQAFRAGQQALRDGDFAAYGEAQQRLEDALRRLGAAIDASSDSSGSPSSNPTPTPTARPSPSASP